MIHAEKRITKALQIPDSSINITLDFDDMFEAEVTTSNDTYDVSLYNGLWRCNCEDFMFRGINKSEGSFICKHILKVLEYIMKE